MKPEERQGRRKNTSPRHRTRTFTRARTRARTEPDAPPEGPVKRVLKGGGTWLVGAIATGAVTVIGGLVTGGWANLLDVQADVTKTPHLLAVIDSDTMTGPGVMFALAEPLRTDRQGLPANRFTQEEMAKIIQERPGYKIGAVNLLLIVQGNRRDPIRILDVRPRILTRAPIPKGTCVYFGAQGEVPVFKVAADLDELWPKRGEGTAGSLLDKHIDLAYGERASFDLVVSARAHAYTWDIDVKYVYGDSPQVQHAYVKDVDGRPFTLTGWTRRYGAYYGIGGGTKEPFAPWKPFPCSVKTSKR